MTEHRKAYKNCISSPTPIASFSHVNSPLSPRNRPIRQNNYENMEMSPMLHCQLMESNEICYVVHHKMMNFQARTRIFHSYHN